MTQVQSSVAEAASAGGAPSGVSGRPAGAGGPPPGVGGPPPGVAGANAMLGTESGFEGRDDLLGKAVALAIRTIKDSVPYQHEMNDALVKMHLTTVQFAKSHGCLQELIAHDVKTMAPMLQRMRGAIEKTGNRELALVGIFDRTPCHYQLCLDTEVSPGKRVFSSPWRLVLEMGRRIGQFDLTEQEVHEIWTKPRLQGYADAIGVKLRVSDIGEGGRITVELLD
jgi:hypothetical protein